MSKSIENPLGFGLGFQNHLVFGSSTCKNFSKWGEEEDILLGNERGVLLLGNHVEYEERTNGYNRSHNIDAVLFRWWKDTQPESYKPPNNSYFPSVHEDPGYQAFIDTSDDSFNIFIGVVSGSSQKYFLPETLLSFAGFCAIVVFSGTSCASLKDVESKWIPLLKETYEREQKHKLNKGPPCPPFVLLATDAGTPLWDANYDRDEATAVATRIGALGNTVFECTLEKGDCVLKAAFEAAIVAGLEQRREQRREQRLAKRRKRCEIQ